MIQAQKLKVKMIAGLVPGFQLEPFNFAAWDTLFGWQLETCTCQDEVVVTKTARASLTQYLV